VTQYCCAIFHFAHDLRQVNTLNDTDAAFFVIAFSLCLNMLNDTHAASVTIALAQHFKKKNKICRWTKQ